MQTATEFKTKGGRWRIWAPVLSLALGTTLVYLLTARWPADDYRDRIVQLLEVLAVFVAAPLVITAFIYAKVWPSRKRQKPPTPRT